MTDRATRAELLRTVGALIEAEVAGASMEPTLHAGDRVRIRCGRMPEPGDVVSWMAGEHLVSHRVLWIDPDGTFMTWGDGTWLPDPPQPKSLALGVVEQVYREGDWQPLDTAPPRGSFAVASGRALGRSFRIGHRITPWIPKLLHAALFLVQRAEGGKSPASSATVSVAPGPRRQ